MTNRPERPKQTPGQMAGGCLVLVVLAGLAFWGLGAFFGGDEQGDVFAEMNASRDDLIGYQTADESTNEAGGLTRTTVTLVMPGVTVPQARAAMADYVSQSQADHAEATVVRAQGAPVYVCYGRYATDERAASVWMGTERNADVPVVDVNCPDPAGS